MKIAVLAPGPVPHVFGGAERFFAGLVDALNRLTAHTAVLVEMPSPERSFADVVASYESWFGFDASAYDLVISGKYPTWMVDHPRHHLYLLHPLRGLYDTYHLCAPVGPLPALDSDTRRAQRAVAQLRSREDIPPVFEALHELLAAHDADHPALAFPGPLIRDAIRALDRVALTPPAIQRFSALSGAVARRPGYLPSWVPVHVAHPPSSLVGLHEGPFDNIFTVSRLDGPKRVDLLIEAMGHVRSDIGLRIGGTGPERERLEALGAGDERITFLGFLEEEQLVEEYARARVVPFVPEEEDFGLIALEAGSASKPVVTTLDAGGAREIVAHRRTGLVVAPSPAEVGAAMDELVSDTALGRRLGAAARNVADSVSWDRLLEAVLGPYPHVEVGGTAPAAGAVDHVGTTPPSRPRRTRARRLVVVTTFPVHPRRGGGQLRSFHLYGRLAPTFDVEVVSLDAPSAIGAGEWHHFSDAFREYVVPKTERHIEAELAAAASAGIPVDDILASRHAELTPAHAVVLERTLAGADAVVLAHPFLARLIRDIDSRMPLIYDAHNAEIALKRLLLAGSPAEEDLLSEVREAEGLAVREAAVVSYCSPGDVPILEGEYGVDLSSAVFVPNGVDAAAVPFVTGPDRVAGRTAWLEHVVRPDATWRAVALFVASWHPPNIEAAEQIAAFAPQLRDVVFLLVGSHCRALERARLPGNVSRLGVVTDGTLRSLLAVADVGLNPMLRGGGSNLKVLEYMAAGLPVVTTNVGARGQPLGPDLSIAVADISSFPAAIEDILSHPEQWLRRVERGREVVEREYDWRVLASNLESAIERALPRMAFASPPTAMLVRSV